MFEGFSPETVDFLWGIRLNNNREWFLEHKDQYIKTLYEPMKALGAEVFQPFWERPGDLLKVSRIYRDARLHHPLPYKESLWLCIRKDVQWWAENPCLFLEINPQGIQYGFCYLKPRVSAMAAFRQEIALRPEPFLELLRRTEAAVGLPVTAQCYRRPKPAPRPELAPFFAWMREIGCIRQEAFGSDTFDAGLAERVRGMFRELIPLYDFFYGFSL